MNSFEELFSIQVFLIVLRETLESAIIVSVLLSFIQQNFSTNNNDTEQEDLNKNLKLCRLLKYQVWIGGLLGLVCCLLVGAGILWAFYAFGKDIWTSTEHYWEGTFSILASIIISVMGMKILRVNKMQDKWKAKLHIAIQNSHFLQTSVTKAEKLRFSERYFMFVLPFVTTLREGLEAIVFIGGIGLNENTSVSAIIASTVAAILVGTFIGVVLYRLGNSLSLQLFLISSCVFLYLVAAGLISKGVWSFELQDFINKCGGADVAESGDGPGSYNAYNVVWHVNCCNGERQEDGPFWMMLTAILGWTNSATYGSVISYNIYWIIIVAVFNLLMYEEKNGHLPLPSSLQWVFRRERKYERLISIATDMEMEPRDSISSRTPLNSTEEENTYVYT